MAKNRLYRDEQLLPGMVLRLRKYYKKNEPIRRVKLTPAPQRLPAAKQAAVPVKAAPSVETPPKTTRPSPDPEPSAPASVVVHLVQPGDTLYAISRKYGVTVADLKSWNQIGSDNILSVGQKLEIRK
jgi:membrane-bound lytic murein transglycosylase D